MHLVPDESRLINFFDKVDTDSTPEDCWLWKASTNEKGYGWYNVNRKAYHAHRWFYEYVNGKLPPHIQLDHICRTPRCVRLEHLEPVTAKENTMRGNGPAADNARKTHCPNGHEYTADNLYITGEGWRRCKTCTRARNKEAWHSRYVHRRSQRVINLLSLAD